jgi:hypothetical protein
MLQAPSGGLFNLGGLTKAPEKSSTPSMAFVNCANLILSICLAPAAITSSNLFGGAKDAFAEKKDAPAGNGVL